MSAAEPVRPVQLTAMHHAVEALARAEHRRVERRLFWQRPRPAAAPREVAFSQLWQVCLPSGHPLALVHLYRDAQGRVVGQPRPRYVHTAQVTWYTDPSAPAT